MRERISNCREKWEIQLCCAEHGAAEYDNTANIPQQYPVKVSIEVQHPVSVTDKRNLIINEFWKCCSVKKTTNLFKCESIAAV